MAGGQSLLARVVRSSALTVAGFGASQVIRLASNLILTRLLFPEAFGMMALVSILLQGLGQFSDVGVTPSILQSKRGDDPNFLNTAWTIQFTRGLLLWIVAALLAQPMAVFYDAPELTAILPVAGITLFLAGMNPTKLDTANRHLMFGRVTAIDISVQLIGIIAAVTLAWITQSVWALVWSHIIGATAHLLLLNLFLPGIRNRFTWHRHCAQELIRFGKWIFLSTVAGFLFWQADKILIGKYLALDTFGVYNIGYFLASFPMLLGGMLTRRLLIPIYRELPPTESRANFLKLRRMRVAVTGGLLAIMALIALSGVWLVGVMYDDRYAAAGAVVVLLACMQLPQVVVLTYDQAALAAGDSFRFFILTAVKAAAMIAALIIGLETAGLLGALLSQGIAMVVIYPVTVWLARRMGAWDAKHDAAAFAVGALIAAAAIALNWQAIAALG
ncbi:oligosaccharide flippase family protein [Mesobacterium pallidum]|uniref:oligosaccharide flippase family protein n=1 Tax=Mesobacterium pallidum TaxID=2872037 RepID=UPI001EE30FA3|nr:oligosaccharide flippase family protein [Mesobacterium pallidum]